MDVWDVRLPILHLHTPARQRALPRDHHVQGIGPSLGGYLSPIFAAHPGCLVYYIDQIQHLY